jgi:PKD repeat protein
MRILAGIALGTLLGISQVQGFTNLGNGTFQSDGSAADTQSAINAASIGNTVLIPAGSFAWSTGLTISKGIRLQGAGGGALVGNSTNSVTIGTGTKTFTTQAGLSFQAGQTVRAIYTANGTANYMQGTVVSYSGTTLSLNIATIGGSGTYGLWTFAIVEATAITHNAGASYLVSVTEPATQSIEIAGVHFKGGIGTVNFIHNFRTTGGKITLIHDCWLSTSQAQSGNSALTDEASRGIIYRCSFDSGFYSGTGTTGNDGNNVECLQFKNPQNTGSWSTPATLGTADTGGTNNFYVEDCYFAGIYLQCMDFDDNSRTVIRNNVFDQSAITSHGLETSPSGNRHYEIYNNTFKFNDIGIYTYNLDYLIFLRGGSGCIFSNSVDNPRSTQWGQKSVVKMTCEAVDRCNIQIPCVTTWPAPHQIGQGNNGTSNVNDPLYIWSNSGSGGSIAPTIYDGTGQYGCNCPSPPPMSMFLQSGRDFIFGGSRPAYTPFAYPHPLRGSGGSTGSNQPPSAAAAASPTNGSAPLTVTFSSAGSSDPEGTPLTFNWTFGDGGTSTAANPSHIYAAAGLYTARLSVSDGTNTTLSSFISINVTTNNLPPIAVASVTSTNGDVPLTVTFSSAGSSDPEGATLTYNWVFGDGTTSTVANPAHTYLATGIYNAQLAVSDGVNTSSSGVMKIRVVPNPPTGLHIIAGP